MPVTFTQLAYLAYRDLGGLRPAQGQANDMLADQLSACNNMMDSWKLDRLMVLNQSIGIYSLTTNVFEYRIGPGQVGSGTDPVTGNQWQGINAPRPTYIEKANIILNNFTPVVRQPVALLEYPQWADIRVQNLPNAIPQGLYYDRAFNPVTGYATIYLWPAPMINYGLELYTWDQSLWNGFADLTTPYIFPPGYVEMIQKQLAVKIYPMVRMYLKVPMDPMTWETLMADAKRLKFDFEAYNAPEPQMGCDGAYLSSNQGGSWVYATGEDRIFGRG